MEERGSLKHAKKIRSDTEEEKATSDKKPQVHTAPRIPPQAAKSSGLSEPRGSASGPADPTPQSRQQRLKEPTVFSNSSAISSTSAGTLQAKLAECSLADYGSEVAPAKKRGSLQEGNSSQVPKEETRTIPSERAGSNTTSITLAEHNSGSSARQGITDLLENAQNALKVRHKERKRIVNKYNGKPDAPTSAHQKPVTAAQAIKKEISSSELDHHVSSVEQFLAAASSTLSIEEEKEGDPSQMLASVLSTASNRVATEESPASTPRDGLSAAEDASRALPEAQPARGRKNYQKSTNSSRMKSVDRRRYLEI